MKKKWAFIVEGKVTEYRDYDLKDIPKHKRHLWTEVVEDCPKFDPTYQEIKGPESVVQDGKVVFKYYVSDLSDERLRNRIKDEANRRLTEIFPDKARQRYAGMLVRIKRGEKLSNKEQLEFDEIERTFPDLENIRKHQEKLQYMTLIPKDYTKDKYWKQ